MVAIKSQYLNSCAQVFIILKLREAFESVRPRLIWRKLTALTPHSSGLGADFDKSGPMFAGQTRVAELRSAPSSHQPGAGLRPDIGTVPASIGCEHIHGFVKEVRYRASCPCGKTRLMILDCRRSIKYSSFRSVSPFSQQGLLSMATHTETQLAALTVVDHTFDTQVRNLISRARKLDLDALKIESAQSELSIDEVVLRYSEALRKISKTAEADALDDAREKIIDSKNFGGLELRGVTKLSAEQQSEALFLVESWLETITSREKSLNYLSCRTSSLPGVRPMTTAQKIFAQHVIGEKPKHGLAAGDVVRIGVDWILSSELSWGVCGKKLVAISRRLISSRQ
jgi:hypothetical protein